MAKTAVLFRSKYGASKQYALMLGRKVSAEVVENEGLTPQLVEEFDTIVVIGGVYAGRVSGLDFLRKNLRALPGRRFAVLAVGATPDSPDNTAELVKRNMKGDLEGIPLYYGRGAFDEGALSFVDKGLCGVLRKAAEKMRPEERSPLESVLSDAVSPVSWVDEAYLAPVISFLSGE